MAVYGIKADDYKLRKRRRDKRKGIRRSDVPFVKPKVIYTDEQIANFVAEYESGVLPQRVIAAKYNVSQAAVSRWVKKGRSGHYERHNRTDLP